MGKNRLIETPAIRTSGEYGKKQDMQFSAQITAHAAQRPALDNRQLRLKTLTQNNNYGKSVFTNFQQTSMQFELIERCNVLFQWRLKSNSYILRKIKKGNKNGVLRVLRHRDHCADSSLHGVAEAQ
jgi:hypothetical protein